MLAVLLFYGKVDFASLCLCLRKILKNLFFFFFFQNVFNGRNLQFVIKVANPFRYNPKLPPGLSALVPGLYTCIKSRNFYTSSL